MEPKIHFAHFRVFDSNTGEYVAKSGVTLGYSEVSPGIIHYAVSYCSPKDVYNKTIGRVIVTARLSDEETRMEAESSFEDFVEICHSSSLLAQETYEDLLNELDDHFDVGIPMAYTEYRDTSSAKNWFQLVNL